MFCSPTPVDDDDDDADADAARVLLLTCAPSLINNREPQSWNSVLNHLPGPSSGLVDSSLLESWIENQMEYVFVMPVIPNALVSRQGLDVGGQGLTRLMICRLMSYLSVRLAFPCEPLR